MMNIYYHIDLT